MQLRTFIGRDLQETLAQVKRELGPEAVILSTQHRKVPAGGSNGRRRREIEVTAAIDRMPLPATEDLQATEPPRGLASPADLETLREEIRDLKALLLRRLNGTSVPAGLTPHPELVAFHQELICLGLSQQVIDKWLDQLEILLAQGNGKAVGRPGAVEALKNILTVVDPWQTLTEGSCRWLFLGATGVGKTTTLAKLAVEAALARQQSVGLISLDHQRLGAIEQLAAFARLADLPLIAASNRAELAQALTTLSHLGCIFIDTPGQNPQGPHLGWDLLEFFGSFPQIECHLLISAGTSEAHMGQSIQGFGALPLASLILTKVDECRDLAAFVNQQYMSGLPLSYLTTGQRVPEDLEPASRSRLASLLLAAEPWPLAMPGAGEIDKVLGHAGL